MYRHLLYFPTLTLGLATLVSAAPPISLEHVWARLADPAGVINATVRNGIVSGEAASFSRDGQYIVTCSKADGRIDRYANSNLTGATAHLRFFDIEGNLLWDKPRSRGPIDPTTGRPNNQPADGVDEMEVAIFSRCDNYIAAGADDGKIEMWQYRDLITKQVLADPILVHSFPTTGGVDSLYYSYAGDLLFAGSEPNGSIHVMRVQGDPTSWQSMHVATHGTLSTHGINSITITEDDKYVASAGTNQRGGLWRLDLTRDGAKLITSVNLVRLTTMTEATSTLREVRFSLNNGPVSTPRKEIIAITAEHDWATRIYSLQALLDHPTSTTSPAPLLTLRNFHTPSDAQRFGSPPEPLAFTPDGRFMLNTGKTRHISGPIPANPAYFRFYETAELKPNRPEPDPVYVLEDQIRNPEFLDFNSDGSRLTSSHHDGSVRLWNVVTTNHVTIASEGFNERTSLHSRWTLAGQTIGTVAPGLGTVGDVSNFTRVFNGKRGSRFIAVSKLDPNTSLPAEHSLTLSKAWSAIGFGKLQVQFALAAEIGEFENDDYVIVEADTTDDGVFETQLATFTANTSINKDLRHVGSGISLNKQFRDFLVDLPTGITQPIRFRIRVRTNSANEAIGFDSLRLLGEPISPQLESVADAYVVEGSASSNYGTDSVLKVKHTTYSPHHRRAFVKLDLGSLTTNASQAKLILEVAGVGGESVTNRLIEIRAVSNDSWTESGVNWNNQPALGSVLASFTLSAAEVGSEIAIDVTQYINQERSVDGFASFAIVQPNGSSALVSFASRESGQGPMLETQ